MPATPHARQSREIKKTSQKFQNTVIPLENSDGVEEAYFPTLFKAHLNKVFWSTVGRMQWGTGSQPLLPGGPTAHCTNFCWRHMSHCISYLPTCHLSTQTGPWPCLQHSACLEQGGWNKNTIFIIIRNSHNIYWVLSVKHCSKYFTCRMLSYLLLWRSYYYIHFTEKLRHRNEITHLRSYRYKMADGDI